MKACWGIFVNFNYLKKSMGLGPYRKISYNKKMYFQLKDIPVQVNLGVPESERKNKQKILVSCDFEFKTQKAEISDDLKDTIDYFQIHQTIINFPQNIAQESARSRGKKEFFLLENFIFELQKVLEEKFPKAKNITLSIEKFPFPEGSVLVKN